MPCLLASYGYQPRKRSSTDTETLRLCMPLRAVQFGTPCVRLAHSDCWPALQVCLGLMMRRRLAGTHPASLTQRRAIEKVTAAGLRRLGNDAGVGTGGGQHGGVTWCVGYLHARLAAVPASQGRAPSAPGADGTCTPRMPPVNRWHWSRDTQPSPQSRHVLPPVRPPTARSCCAVRWLATRTPTAPRGGRAWPSSSTRTWTTRRPTTPLSGG